MTGKRHANSVVRFARQSYTNKPKRTAERESERESKRQRQRQRQAQIKRRSTHPWYGTRKYTHGEDEKRQTLSHRNPHTHTHTHTHTILL